MRTRTRRSTSRCCSSWPRRSIAAATVDAATLLAMGQLTEVLDRRRLAEREDFAARFADYDSSATRRSLDALVDHARSSG